MHSLAAIGRWLTSGELWGECTAASRGFYAKLMQQSTIRRVVRVTDRFQFNAAALRRLARSNPVQVTPCPPPPLETPLNP